MIEDVWQRAREAHPTLSTSDADFFAFVRERIAEDELAQRHVDDLYLACACAAGEAAALVVFEQTILPRVERALVGIAQDADTRRELLQMLREQMLVAHDGPPGIAAYDGRAPLAIWLRVCAARVGLRVVGKQRRDAPLEDVDLDQLAPGVPDPQLAYMREHYGAQFRSAFAEALRGLEPRERNLLRYAVLDGLGIDQIAAIYHMHRATAARQIKRAREALVDGTRAQMQQALGVGESELESIFRVLVSMTNVTLREMLHPARE